MRALLPVVLVLLAASSGDLAAQHVQAPRSGDRVRITGGTTSGEFTFLTREGDTLVLRKAMGVDTLRVPLSSIGSLAVRRSRTSGRGAARGAGIGFLIGGGTGALIGLMSGDDPPGFMSFSAGEKAVVLGGALGLLGTLIGVIGGASNPGQRWEALPTGTFTRVEPGVDGGVNLAFSIPIGG